MTTKRLYYDDSATHSFTARIIERLTLDDKPAIVLDQTYFYPTGGGQPHDIGTINGVAIVDVQTRKSDMAVIHVLAQAIDTDDAACEIDWVRRFDYMQQHTGQHILTQAFVQTANLNTVGFHLSDDTVTIDLDQASVDTQTLESAEMLANSIVYENRPITARYVKPDDADGVRIRRIPEAIATDGLRVIDIGGFDVTACGGTHVASSGAVGIIKVIKAEKRGDKTRIEFRCGSRALMDYRVKNNVLLEASAKLNSGYWEVSQAVERLQEQNRAQATRIRALSMRLLEYEAQLLIANAVMHGNTRVIKAVVDYDTEQTRLLARTLTAQPAIIALIASVGSESGYLVFARSQELPHNMNEAFQRASAILTGLKGGGKPDMVQGGCAETSVDVLAHALEVAENSLLWL